MFLMSNVIFVDVLILTMIIVQYVVGNIYLFAVVRVVAGPASLFVFKWILENIHFFHVGAMLMMLYVYIYTIFYIFLFLYMFTVTTTNGNNSRRRSHVVCLARVVGSPMMFLHNAWVLVYVTI